MESGRRPTTGFHAIAEALKRAGGEGVLHLSDDRKRNRALRALAVEHGVAVVAASSEELARISGSSDHRGAVYVATASDLGPRTSFEAALGRLVDGPRLVVVLDHINDPHNLGAVLRSVDQFGGDIVVIPERRSASVTPAVARASAGASAHVRTAVVSNVAGAIRRLKEARFWVYGAHLEGERIDRVAFPERVAIVMGSEGRGLSELVSRECDRLIRIPSVGHLDSLNVSVAAGIVMYEVRRSQGYFRELPAPAGDA